MKRIFFTITGTNHHYGQEFFEPKMSVRLVKEPDNEVDTEAIKVELEGLGHVGYAEKATAPAGSTIRLAIQLKELYFMYFRRAYCAM